MSIVPSKNAKEGRFKPYASRNPVRGDFYRQEIQGEDG